MIKILDTRKATAAALDKALFARHAEEELSRIEASVRAIVDAVRLEGDRALVRFTGQFDGVALRAGRFKVEQTEIRSAYGRVSEESLRALRRASGKITSIHKKNLRRDWLTMSPDGSVIGQKLTPIERVGVYCPGGTAIYPSSALMNIAPAKVAGCTEIIMVSPPSSEGTIHPALLVAADIAGATGIYRVGGAQAVAALAFGTRTIPKVDKIVGPGNIYVTLAKRLVTGHVAIDMEAGPSEILIIADSAADPRLAAADMLSQAEHDVLSSTILVTTSRRLVDEVISQIKQQMQGLDRGKIIRASLRRNGLAVIARSIKEAVEIANRRAPEHLELLVKNPNRILEKIDNAGVVFLGAQTPNSVGDYMAGPNHVLPTGGRARFSSPLNTEDFRKLTNVVGYSSKKLKSEAGDIIALAELEGLTAHANAIRVRLKK